MTVPRFDADEFERSLLSSADGDGMPAARKAALLTALGVAGVSTVAVSSGAVAGTAKAATAGLAASKAKLAFTAATLKWLAAGALGGAVLVGATKGIRHAREVQHATLSSQERGRAARAVQHSGPLATHTAHETAKAITAPEPNEPLPIAIPAPEASIVFSAPPPSAVTPTGAPTSQLRPAQTRARVPAPILRDEQRSIEQARAALEAGDVQGATRALDAHDSAFPRGAFSEESRMLRIDTMARSGDRVRARKEARTFLAQSPSTPYAARLRDLAGDER
jgi:hypothetical protein